jgi:TolB-like protein/Flp pilus assembly protein TadD
MIGKTISHYRIFEKLGEGGMGVVYKAEDMKLKRTVALKFLPPELTRDPEAKARFIQEAQAASALDHPNICNIHEIDETADGRLFICMAYYEGETLKERIGRGSLLTADAVGIAMQIGTGLAKAHAQGIVHRDVKPANIVITTDGVAKILDFGLAKLAGQVGLTRDSSTLGTVAYMSPEQVRGDAVDERTDIWALGVVLFQMVAGKLPFKGDYEQAIMYSIVNEEAASLGAARPEAPQELRGVVAKALAKAPDARYRRMAEMLADLESVRQKQAPGASAARRVKPARVKRELVIAVCASVAVVAAVVLARTYVFAPREKPIASLAVLPFQNISGDPEQEYFSNGITEALITELSKIEALRVISRTSVMQFKESDKPLPDIAARLHVDAVVEGSVQRVQDEVRVTAQLVRAVPEKHLWANTYTQSYVNVLTLESDISQEIAREIRVTVTADEKERIAASRPVNPAAHEAYLKGHYYLSKLNPADVGRAMEYLSQSIAIDSTYAPAYVDVAAVYDMTIVDLTPREVVDKINTCARKALSLDPTISEAHALLGEVKLTYDWDWPGAEAEYRKALALDPNSPLAHGMYGQYLMVVGRSDEALRESIRAKELNPLDMTTVLMLSNKYYFRREYDKAAALIGEAQERDSTNIICYLMLGRLRLAQGKYEEAVSLYRKGLGDSTGAFEGFGAALARSGRTDAARRTIAYSKSLCQSGAAGEVDIARTFLALEEPDSAFYWLGRAYDLRDVNLPWVRIDPMFDGIRSDPRYAALMKRLKLEP